MFGIGMPEMIVILAVALIVLGPKKLPEIARSLGKAMREFKKATNDLKSAINLDTDLKDIRDTIDDVKGDVRNMAESYIDKAPAETGPVAEQENKTDQTPAPASAQLADSVTADKGTA